MVCSKCNDRDVVEIGFSNLAEGTTFRFCRRCEHRWWAGERGELGLSDVLAARQLKRAS